MLNVDNPRVRELLFEGGIGLEKESLRITEEGFFATTPNPFPDDPNIVMDFCENQTEINTSVEDNVHDAMEQLKLHTQRIQKALSKLPKPEYLWPFSNPPYIKRETDIPIARYKDAEKEKENYRHYLAERYGRYKMTFSGIHFNYSFSDDLLRADYEAKGGGDYREYKDRFYISLASKAQIYNWLIVAVTAASPLLDSSYVEKGVYGRDVFNGMGSTRCSELGYWNLFTPILDYTDIEKYVDSILAYVDAGLIHSSAELYYPVRLKPAGVYRLKALKEQGVSHIELRMIDLNPLVPWGLDERDAFFIQILLIYLAAIPDMNAGVREQVFTIQNTKNAAHYDLKTVNVITPDNRTLWVADAAIDVLLAMKDFYLKVFSDVLRGVKADETGDDGGEMFRRISETIDYQIAKFEDADKRYAWKIREQFSNGFVEKGLALCRKRQGLNITEE